MSNKLKLSQNIVLDLEKRNVKKIKIFFYESWCSWIKIDILEEDFLEKNLLKLDLNYKFWVYIEKKDKEKFENASITKTVKSDHSWIEKVRYIFASENVKQRCWCGSSFSFENKKTTINLKKLKQLKEKFN